MREGVDRVLDGRAAFSQAVIQLIDLARHELQMVAPDFSDWPQAGSEGAAALRAALQRGVRLRVLVADSQHAVRKPHPDSRRARLIIAMPSVVEAHADRLATAWDESVDCLPATTLGL